MNYLYMGNLRAVEMKFEMFMASIIGQHRNPHDRFIIGRSHTIMRMENNCITVYEPTERSNPSRIVEQFWFCYDINTNVMSYNFFNGVPDYIALGINHCVLNQIDKYKEYATDEMNVLVPVWHYKDTHKKFCIMSPKKAMSISEIVEAVDKNPVCIPCIVVTKNDRIYVDEVTPRICLLQVEECTAEMLSIPPEFTSKSEDFYFRKLQKTPRITIDEVRMSENLALDLCKKLYGQVPEKLPVLPTVPEELLMQKPVLVPVPVPAPVSKQAQAPVPVPVPAPVSMSVPAPAPVTTSMSATVQWADQPIARRDVVPPGAKVFKLLGRGMNGPEPSIPESSIPEVLEPQAKPHKKTHRGKKKK